MGRPRLRRDCRRLRPAVISRPNFSALNCRCGFHQHTGPSVQKNTSQAKSRDDDFQAWLVGQANALHAHQHYSLDWEALAEELEDRAAAEKRELRKRLRNLLFHLLKWQYHSGRKTNSWRRTINNERDEIDDLLKYSPSLVTELELSFEEVYERARRDASDLLRGVAKATLPGASPWTLETIRDSGFWPDAVPVRRITLS